MGAASFERVLRGGKQSHWSTVEALVSALVSAVEPPVTYGQVKTSVKILITACFERVLRGGKKSHRSTVEALVLAVEPPVIYGQGKTSVKRNEPPRVCWRICAGALVPVAALLCYGGNRCLARSFLASTVHRVAP
jgi:hypothetical protein